MKLTIGYLYGDIMNTYGDVGNIITLTKRAEWRGIEVKVHLLTVGDKIDSSKIDLYFFGGGQDAGQEVVGPDLIRNKKAALLEAVERGVPMLTICGGYQLFGKFYRPHQGADIPGIGLFQAHTMAGSNRMIGNLVINSRFGDLVGFENHSGQTFLDEGTDPLGKVVTGSGNNGEDQTEGCIYKNAIGCYMHGSLLPKNPELADWLIKKALEVRYGENIEFTPIDDSLENSAHKSAIERFAK